MKKKTSPAPSLPRFRSVLVPLDGSSFAEQALPWAAAIARPARARLRLVLVHQSPFPPPLDEASVRLYIRIELMLRKSQDQYQRKVAARLKEEQKVQVARAMLDGTPAPAIAEYVSDIGADLVVMTTHGLGGIRRAWLGSVADQLVRRLEVPMLIIRPKEDGATSGEAPAVRAILVALDGSPRAEAVLPVAAALARLWGSRLVLIQVVQPVGLMIDLSSVYPVGLMEDLSRLAREQARDYLQGVADRLTSAGVAASAVVVLGTSVFDAIQEAARAPDIGMVALATHGRGGVRRLVLGSVADKLVRGGERPVLVTRPRGR